jgi:hydrogenase maturation protease
MIEPVEFKIAVLGLGNLMRTDDAVGMIVVQLIRADKRFPTDLRLIEGGTLGLDLLEDLRGISHVLAIDAVDTGAASGTLSKFCGPDLADLPIGKSAHLLGFSDLMNVLLLMNAAPREIVLLGVQPESTDWGTELTSAVGAAQGPLIEEALRQIEGWTATHLSEAQTECQSAALLSVAS